jgi:hypothetical protein
VVVANQLELPHLNRRPNAQDVRLDSATLRWKGTMSLAILAPEAGDRLGQG